MEAAFPVVNWTGRVLDWMDIGPVTEWLKFALDINFLLASFLLEILAWLLVLIYKLSHTVLIYFLLFGQEVLLSLIALIEPLVEFTVVGLQPLWTFLYSCYSSSETLKLLGHLASHGVLRSREILNRSIPIMVAYGHALLRHAYDICAIARSLVDYVINSLVNICLIGIPKLSSLVLALWAAVAEPLWQITNVLAALLVHLSSGVVAMVVILWTPCQLGLELLASAVLLLAGSILSNLTVLLLLACVLAVLNQHHARLSYHRLREDVVWLSRLALEAWCRVWRLSLQVARWPNWGGAPGAPQGGPRRVFPEVNVRTNRRAPTRGQERLHEVDPTAGQDPWKLLEENEERQKCVICLDQNKTVLLLPCRHLCLCQACREMVMHQPIYLRNCPLCRRRIRQTLSIYT